MKNQELISGQAKAEQALSLEQIQSIRIRQQPKNESPKNQQSQQKSRLDIYRKEKQQNQISHQSSLAQEEQSKRQLNNHMTEFATAWKLQTGFGVLMIEKVSQIVHNYFKMIPEMAKRNQEIQILVIYNKSLLEIMGKFEDHQRRLLSKLRTIEQFNVKIMRQLCIVKNRQFKPPQIKDYESIFSKFSFKDLKYVPEAKQEVKLDQNYVGMLKNLMRDHFLKPFSCLPTIETNINQLQTKDVTNIIQNQLQDLKQLKQKIIVYNAETKNVTTQNMFDLYDLRQSIKNQLMAINQIQSKEENEKQEKKFVQQVIKIHAGLSKMQESELQTCLKLEKQTRKRIKKQRIKQQEVFLRVCQKAESQNTQLKKDIGNFKQKIISLQQQLNKAKAQLDFKTMKQRANKSSLLDDSMINQSDIAKQKKQFSKQTHKAMQTDLKKLKDQNEKLQKKISENQTRELSRPILMSRIRQRAKSLKISIKSQWQQTKIIQVLLQKISETIKKQPEQKLSHSMQVYKEDQLISPRFQQKLFGFGNISEAQFLKTIQQKNETQDIQQIQNKNKQLQRQIGELRKKNQQNKKLLTSKDQVLRKTLEDHQADLKLKNSKINELVKQYEQFQTQIKQLRFHNQLLRVKNQWAERLSQKIIRQIEQITIQDISPSKSLILVAELFQKLKVIIGEYQQQIKKQEQAYEQNRQVNIRQDMSTSRNAINSHDQSAISLKSMFPKMRQKKEPQIFSIVVEKQQFIKLSYEKFKKIKSLTNQGVEQIERDERFVKKSPNKQMNEQMKDYLKFSELKLNLKNSIKEDKKSLSRQQIKKSDEDSYDFDRKDNKRLGIQMKSSTQLGLALKESNNRNQLTKTQNLEVVRGQKQNDNNSSDVKQIKSNQSGDKSRSKSKSKGKDKSDEKDQEKIGKVLPNQDNANQNVLSDIDLKSQKSKGDEKINKQSNKSLDAPNSKLNEDNPEKKSKLSKKMERIQAEAKQIQSKIQKQKDLNESRQKQKNQSQLSPVYKKKASLSGQKNENKTGLDKKDNFDNKLKQEGLIITQFKKLQKISEQSQTFPSPTIKSNKLQQGQRGNEKQFNIKKIQTLIDERQNKANNKNQKLNNLPKKNTKELMAKNKQKEDQQFKDQISRLSQQPPRGDSSQPMIRINNVTRRQESSQSIISKQEQKNKKQIPPLMSRNSSIDEVSLSYSRDGSMQKNKSSQLKSNLNQGGIISMLGNNSKLQYFTDKDGQDDPLFHEKVLQKLDKLHQDLDGLDFFELYNRYKQAIDCLDIAEKVNRMYEIRYQKFVYALKNKKQQTENFSYEEQLFYMQKLIDQQTVKIQLQDKKFNESVLKHIKVSQSMIQRQLKSMRQQFNAGNDINKPKKKF